MSTWLAIVAVGAVSYVFRAAPVVLFGRIRITEGVDRTVRHAGAAAVTALLVGAVRQGGHASSLIAVLVATGVALVVAARGGSMLRIVMLGGCSYATIVVVEALV
jgi:branched-subunit amino acid transport protein